MPIVDNGVVTIGTSVPLAGMYQSVAGQTNPTGYPLNGLRQGTGRYWRATDNTPTLNTTRQLGLIGNTKYRCLQGQSQQAPYTLLTGPGENINIQGSITGSFGGGGVGAGEPAYGYAPVAQPGQAGGDALIIQTGTSLYVLVTNLINGGDGGGGGAGGGGVTQAQANGAAGGNGGKGISSQGTVTVYVNPAGTVRGGSGGGGGGGGLFFLFPPEPGTGRTRGGNGGGGGYSGAPGQGGSGGGGGSYPANGSAGVGSAGQPGSGGGGGGAGVQFQIGPFPGNVPVQQWNVGAGGNGGGAPLIPFTLSGTAAGPSSVTNLSPYNTVGLPGPGGSAGLANTATVILNTQSQGVIV